MSAPLWTIEAMAKATGATLQGALPPSVPGLSIDTRTIQAGEAFFALKDVRDGHDFVKAALTCSLTLRPSLRNDVVFPV